MTQIIQDIATRIDEIVEKLKTDTQTVKDDLANNYYTKAIIEERFSAGIKTSFAAALPETGNECIIYLVPVSDETTNLNDEVNVYKEYMWVNINASDPSAPAVYQWESLGSTELKLDDYYKKTEDDALLATKTNLTQASIPNKLSDLTNDLDFVTIQLADTLPATGELNVIYVIPSANPVYEDNKYDEYLWTGSEFDLIGASDNVVQSQLNDYYTKTETYNMTEVNTAIDNLTTLVDTETEKYLPLK